MNTNIPDGDYVLEEGGAWLEVKGFAIRIHATDEGVAVDIYPNKAEHHDAIASCYAFDNDDALEDAYREALSALGWLLCEADQEDNAGY
jgi:hypothetical protein